MIAFVFPGQGSQKVGMAKFLYDEFKSAKETLEEASDILKTDMEALMFTDPNDELNLTQNTQPALVIAATIYHRSLKEVYGVPALISAGHSLGEYSALVANGVMTFQDALLLTRQRGAAMQKAVPVGEGAMLAVIGANDTDLLSAIKETEGTVEVANYNCPGQIVVSGSASGIANLKEFDTASRFGKKWKMIPLKVSAPFHCSLMQPAEDAMRPLIEGCEMQAPLAPVIQNYSALESTDVNAIKSQLIQQITGSVRWTASIERMGELGVKKIIEVGPGKVLSGLVKKIDSAAFKSFNIENLADFKAIEAELVFNEQ